MQAHSGQKDKQGQPYIILHPLRVMFKMTSEEEMMAAVLHDALEDTKKTADTLRQAGVSGKVIEIVQCLTKRGGQDILL